MFGTRRAERPARAAHRAPIAVIIALLAAVNILGIPYYRLSPMARVRSPMHALLKPSGLIGQSAGILALLIFCFLWLYQLRKKVKWLAFTGSVARWLDVHIVAALGLPLLVAIHASWRFDGIVGLGYYAMLVVCASGIVGRYLYIRIPRSRTGVASTRDDVTIERRRLITEIAAATGLDPFAVERELSLPRAAPSKHVLHALGNLVADDIRRWRMTRALRERLAHMRPGGKGLDRVTIDRAVELAGREVALAQQLRMLDATQRLFGLWHVAHRPFAVTALVAVLVHVTVVVVVGATWFW